MADQKNLILAVVLTFVILLGFQYLFPTKQPVPEQESGIADPPRLAGEVPVPPAPDTDTPPLGDASVPVVAPEQVAPAEVREAVLAGAKRVTIRSNRLEGSIPLTGQRIDDLLFVEYTEELDPDSPNIVFLSPAGLGHAYYAEFGWATMPSSNIESPSPNTVWTVDRSLLEPGRPVTLTWDNGAGLRFSRTIALDEEYMFTVTQRIENNSPVAVTLAPYGLLSRTGTPETSGFVIMHEGALGAFDGALFEVDYDDMRDESQIEKVSTGGWIGITDKYWLAALIPEQDARFTGHFRHRTVNGDDKYLVDFLLDTEIVPAGGAVEVTSRLFAGAKEVAVIDGYEESLGIVRFDRAIDWGWLFWLTKPIFQVLDVFNGIIGNFGVAILALTVCIKAIFFPLANKSYVAMSKMKKLQPKMTAIRDTYKDDKVRQQQETMALYKKEKVNPMAGCLPMVIQIPVFFALYKVLFISIEMRHAPFFGWVQDLSAPDPLLVLNLFGLLPWTPPEFLAIGIWPLLMGLTMFLQMKLNPQPADPMQAKIFMIMPIMFTFLLARFPVGLVIYWTWNNMLSMAQQWVIMKRMGATG